MSGSRLSMRHVYTGHLCAFGGQMHRPTASTQKANTATGPHIARTTGGGA